MNTDSVTPLRRRMIEDMNARKLCTGMQRGHNRLRASCHCWSVFKLRHRFASLVLTFNRATRTRF
jgi:hypothetical protein